MKPIVQLVGPDSANPPKSFDLRDAVKSLLSGAVKSGLIASILAFMQAVDTSKMTPLQVFGVGLVVLTLATAQRLYRTGPTDDDAPSPLPDGPAPDPDASISARKAA